MSEQQTWQARAAAVLPEGGFGNFDPDVIIAEGRGARVRDINGNEYIDFLLGSGPMLLGHGDPEVLDALTRQLPAGVTFFANNPQGIELAEEVQRAVRCAERVRFVSTGGEADMYAMRLARAFTGRPKILKFEGGYHGMSPEAQMSLAPTQLVDFPLAVPDSAGIPEGVRDAMLVAPFNDIAALRSLLAEHGQEIAAVIAEPMQRIVMPEPDYLEAMRSACDDHNVLLIFDEIVTGFRFGYGGAQARYDVVPDICTLGKILGGGLPLAALAGRADIMAHFDATQVATGAALMHHGTLSGNPLAATAGLKTLEILRRPGQYERLQQIGETLMAATREALAKTGLPHQVIGDPSVFDVVFTAATVRDYRDGFRADHALSQRYNTLLREQGLLKSPGKTYVSLALTDNDIEQTMAAIAYAAHHLQP